MSLTWHIIRKDFRAHWAAVVGCWAAHGVYLGFGALLWVRSDIGADAMVSVYQLLWLLAEVALIAATMALINEDGAAGASWWKTRPMSGSRVVAAKLGAFALWLWLPLVGLTVLWWWYAGLTMTQVGWALAALIARLLLATFLSAAMTALTGALWRSLLVAGGTVLFVLWFVFMNPMPTDMEHDFGERLAFTDVVTWLEFAGASGAVVALVARYRTRLAFRSAGFGVAVALVALALVEVAAFTRFEEWRLTWWPPTTGTVPPTGHLELQASRARLWPHLSSNALTTVELLGRQSTPGDFRLRVLRQTWAWPDGFTITQPGYGQTGSESWGGVALNEKENAASSHFFSGLPEAVVEKWRHVPARWTADCLVAEPVMEKKWELPLRESATGPAGRIVAVQVGESVRGSSAVALVHEVSEHTSFFAPIDEYEDWLIIKNPRGTVWRNSQWRAPSVEIEGIVFTRLSLPESLNLIFTGTPEIEREAWRADAVVEKWRRQRTRLYAFTYKHAALPLEVVGK